MRNLIFSIGLLALAGCSTVPDSVQVPESVNLVSYQQVAGSPDTNKDRIARWGGVVAHIENHTDSTLLEVVHFPLRSYGRPILHDESIGRFRVYVDGFLDPMVFEKGRMMTFAGQVIGTEEGVVGEHQYVFPTLHADGYHLWKDYDRVEVETISVWPSIHYRRGAFGYRGWFGWHAWPYHQRVIVRRKHDHHGSHHHGQNNNSSGNDNVRGGQRVVESEGNSRSGNNPRGRDKGKVDP